MREGGNERRWVRKPNEGRQHKMSFDNLCKLFSGCPFLSFFPFEKYNIQFIIMFKVNDLPSFL